MDYYLAKLKIQEEGKKAGKPYQILIQDTGITEAEAVVNEHMKGFVSDWSLEAIIKTKIEDVIIKK